MEMWRSGNALRPYFHDVRMVVYNKAMFPDLQAYSIVDKEALSFIHFPIRDCGITDDERVLELARTLVKAIAEGEVIYLHCWGGHGRTGTLVCIMLHLMYSVRTYVHFNLLHHYFNTNIDTCDFHPHYLRYN